MKNLQNSFKGPKIEITCNAVQDNNDGHKTIHRSPIFFRLPNLFFSSGLNVQSFFDRIFL
jgi:hypothetical protein